MKKVILLLLAVFVFSGCGHKADNRDHLLGWHKIPRRHYRTREIIPDSIKEIIPVYKVDDKYYSSAYIGMEVPLEPCPEGLRVSDDFPSLKGTIIGVDEASGENYLIFCQNGRETWDQHFVNSETNIITSIKKPSWFLDAEAEPPRSNDDFIGWFQPVWCRWVYFEAREERENVVFSLFMFTGDKDKSWGEKNEMSVFQPYTRRLGFFLPLEENHHLQKQDITYNKKLKRYEMTIVAKKPYQVLKIPLLKIDQIPSMDYEDEVLRTMRIGLPMAKP